MLFATLVPSTLERIRDLPERAWRLLPTPSLQHIAECHALPPTALCSLQETKRVRFVSCERCG